VFKRFLPQTDYEKLASFARSKIKLRLDSEVESSANSDVASMSCQQMIELNRATQLALERLSARLGFSWYSIPQERKLSDSLVIYKHDISLELLPAWSKLGLGDSFEPFAFDLLEVFEKHCNHRKLLNHLVSNNYPIPSSENDWLNWIHGLTAIEFMNIFQLFPQQD
jgi:hypothetical protein